MHRGDIAIMWEFWKFSGCGRAEAISSSWLPIALRSRRRFVCYGFKPQPNRTEANLLAFGNLCRCGDSTAGHVCSVFASEILENRTAICDDDSRVSARDGRRVDFHGCTTFATKDVFALMQRERPRSTPDLEAGCGTLFLYRLIIHKCETERVNCLYESRLPACFPQSPPDFSDEVIEIGHLYYGIGPYLVIKFTPGDDIGALLDQDLEQSEGFGREVNDLPSTCQPTSRRIENKLAKYSSHMDFFEIRQSPRALSASTHEDNKL
jgi:hypothetical protein